MIVFLLARFFLLAIVAVMFLSGCALNSSMDRSALAAAKPRSIVVIPPRNHSIEVNASYTFLSTISRPLAEKGYYVFPVAVIDMFMKENGLPTPEEMNDVPLDKIRENIGADAVLYTVINSWGQKFRVFSSTTVVSADLQLVDAISGELLWQGKAFAERQPNNNNNGDLVSLLVGAVIEQIAGSMADHTYELSRQANTALINNHSRGLLNGPYRPDDAQ